MAAVSPTLLAVLTIGVGALILGIIIGIYTMPVTMNPEIEAKVSVAHRLNRDYYKAHESDDPVLKALINGPNAQRIRTNLKFLSVEPHLAGTQRDQVLSEFYKKFFTDAGLDRVYTVSYTVLLSSANISRPNKIYLIGESQEPVIISQHQETPIRPEEMNANVPAYNAYSPTGDILGDPVYCNYGREEDFRLLVKETNIRLEEKICIIRYGKIFRGSKVRNAARYGCSAVVLYSDPSLIAPFGTEAAKVYPHSIWMNGKTIQRGNIRVIKGDPLTPGFASSIDGGFREEKDDSDHVLMPTIPCQPIGYDDAKSILERMSGINTEADIKFRDWKGKLNITYRLGPGFQQPNQKLRIVVNNELETKVVHNVIGILNGQLEPDRYILAGNHRDAWSFGTLDAVTGSASLLETVKVIGSHHKATGWRPRRSLVFASWAAEEQGLIGSYEWVEEMRHLLAAKAVAYVNIDTCVSGPMFHTDASPSLMDSVRQVIRKIPAHHIDDLPPVVSRKKNQTLYDSAFQQQKIVFNDTSDKLRINLLTGGSDQVPFTFYAGVPSINIRFKHDKRKYPVSSYPAYHSNYETMYLLEQFIDPTFAIHQTCSRLISMLLYSLSCETLLPVKFTELSQLLQSDYKQSNLASKILEELPNSKHELDLMEKSIEAFVVATQKWTAYVDQVNSSGEWKKQPYLARQINDISMQVERIFTSGRHLYNRVDNRNLLYGNPSSNYYRTVFFPGLHDLVDEIQFEKEAQQNSGRMDHSQLLELNNRRKNLNRELRKHLTEITLAFRLASQLLTDKWM